MNFHLWTVAAIGALALAGPSLAQEPNEVIEEAMELTEKALDGREEELANDPAALHAVVDWLIEETLAGVN